MMNPFGTKSLTNGLGLVAAQPKTMPTMSSLLGNPALLAGLGLLGAARDSRINPYQAALGGVMGAQQFTQNQSMMDIQRQKMEAQQQEAEAKKAEAQRKAEAMQKYQAMIDAGETPDAVLAYQAGIPVDAWKAQYGGGERKMYKGADGYNYWQDAPTERVNPSIQAQSSGGGIGQYNPRDYTTESWSAFAESGDPSALVRYEKQSDLPSGIINWTLEATDAAEKSSASARNYAALADRLEAADLPSGVEGASSEFLKQITGQQDFDTLLRKDWQSLRVSSAINNLPPGVASDKDIALVMSSTLDTYSNPNTIASYLRGLSKASKIESEYNRFKSQYVLENRSVLGLTDSWREYAKRNADKWGLSPESPGGSSDIQNAAAAELERRMRGQ